MQITVEIPDDLAARIEARGFALDSYLCALLQTDLSEKYSSAGERRIAVDAMRQFAPFNGFTTGSSSLKSTIHEGHKY